MEIESCQHRLVSDDGRITCAKIAVGDHEVSPDLCLDCPARVCDCRHLRFSLERISWSPIVVRRASGRVEVWDDQPPQIRFLRAACVVTTLPVSSPADCLTCTGRQRWSTPAVEGVENPIAGTSRSDNVIAFVRPLSKEPAVPRLQT